MVAEANPPIPFVSIHSRRRAVSGLQQVAASNSITGLVCATDKVKAMAELEPPTTSAPDAATPAAGRGKDDVALELMKFIAVTTGYGRTQTNSAGFSGKPGTR